jgi:hypothetical protein
MSFPANFRVLRLRVVELCVGCLWSFLQILGFRCVFIDYVLDV